MRCGTFYAYRCGCRCVECVQANRDRALAWRDTARAHGRCVQCNRPHDRIDRNGYQARVCAECLLRHRQQWPGSRKSLARQQPKDNVRRMA